VSYSSDSFDWAIDNVYIGSGCSLECVQHGSCVNGTCRYVILLCSSNLIIELSLFSSCDDGFSGDLCQPEITVPSFREEFESTLQSNRWPVVLGGSIVSASVASGNALVFSSVSSLKFMLTIYVIINLGWYSLY